MCGTKLAQHTVERTIWALFRVQGEFIHACESNKPSGRISLTNSSVFEVQHTAADLCAHDPPIVVDTGGHRQDRNERKNTHTRVVAVHRAILFAPARPNRPIFDDCEHAWAVFVSVERHATNKSTMLGRYFFHRNPCGRVYAVVRPGRAHQNHRHRRCEGRRRDRRARASFEAGPGCGARGRRRGLAGQRVDAQSTHQ